MAEGGRNASFKFNGVVYNADDCLQGWDLNSALNDVVYQCNGYDKHAIGTKSASFRASLALAATDTTKVSALAPGTSGAFEGHPAGDTATYIEITSTRAQITAAPVSTAPNSIVLIDVEMMLDDITYAAAT